MALKRKVYKERENKHQGRREEWSNLPRRKCDNCGVSYKPSQPTQRFHNPQCRFQFSRNGSAILQLKERIAPEVRKQVQLEVVCPECNGKGTVKRLFNEDVRKYTEFRSKSSHTVEVVCETCINGRVLTPLGADILALVTSGHAARIVQNVQDLLRQGAK